MRILLLAASLALPGPTRPILEEVQAAALMLVTLVGSWSEDAEDSVLFASNYVVSIPCIRSGRPHDAVYLDVNPPTGQPHRVSSVSRSSPPHFGADFSFVALAPLFCLRCVRHSYLRFYD